MSTLVHNGKHVKDGCHKALSPLLSVYLLLMTFGGQRLVAPIFYIVCHYAPTLTSSVPPFIFCTSSGTQDSRSAKNYCHKLDI